MLLLRRSVVLAAFFLFTLVGGGCGLLPSSTSDCPDTVEEGGLVDGIDLGAPDWLPVGLPLPDGLSLRHLNHGYLGEQDILTGFIPAGDPEAVLNGLRRDLVDAGYEELLVAKGFVPVANEAVVVLNEGLGILVTIGVADQEAPVRTSDDECPWVPGALVSLRIEQADADAARALYSRSSLTQGVARATMGSRDFAGQGECLVHGGTSTFSSTSGDLIVLSFEVSDSGTVGSAAVTVEGEAVFNLDAAELSQIQPMFQTSESGFAVEGVFVDGLGSSGLVEGSVVVDCG